MGWIYILIRTYPFWAIPTGIALITAAIRTKKGSKSKKLLYSFLGLLFLASSTYFLILEGHKTAVPFVHRVFQGQR